MESKEQQLDPVEVTAAVIIHDQTVLITQRGEGQHLAGSWEFPGGKLEDGEALEECLQREINEELSISISVAAHIITTTHEYGNKAIKLHAFHASLVSGELTLHDHSDAQWVSINELDTYEFAPADLPIIEHLKEHVLFIFSSTINWGW